MLNTVTGEYGLFKNEEALIYFWDGAAKLVQVPEDTSYTAIVYMKDSFADGSDAFDGKLWAVLHGEHGRTPELRLSNPYYDTAFGTSSATSLSLTTYDIGALLSIDMRVVR